SGCFGFKPSFGRIPLGPAGFVSTSALTVPGPLTRTVRDAALYLDCTAGAHPSDPFSLPAPAQSYLATIEDLPPRLRIAFSPDLGYARVQRAVMERVEAAVQRFAAMGHTVERWPDKLPDLGDAWTSLITMDICAQHDDILDRYRDAIGKALMSVVDRTRRLTVAEIAVMQRMRADLNARLESLFAGFDLLLTPTMPTEAFAAGGPPPAEIDGHPIPLLGAVAFTYPFNLSGHPAASVPAGLTPDGLPVGLQIVGARLRDEQVLQAARAYERAFPWNERWPMDGD
uniref:amidase n=1 Tax=Desulfosarcina cetonica TaxID=90730 RepID=UPI001C449D7F